MPEKDYVASPVKIGYSGVLALNDLYKVMQNWFKLYKYKVKELDHKVSRGEGGSDIYLKWAADKKMSDYLKFTIETEIFVNNMVEVESKKTKKKLARCDLRVIVQGYIAKDIEDVWTGKAFLKFMREAYDRFVIGSKMEEYEKELLGDVRKFVNEVEAFIRVLKMS